MLGLQVAVCGWQKWRLLLPSGPAAPPSTGQWEADTGAQKSPATASPSLPCQAPGKALVSPCSSSCMFFISGCKPNPVQPIQPLAAAAPAALLGRPWGSFAKPPRDAPRAWISAEPTRGQPWPSNEKQSFQGNLQAVFSIHPGLPLVPKDKDRCNLSHREPPIKTPVPTDISARQVLF